MKVNNNQHGSCVWAHILSWMLHRFMIYHLIKKSKSSGFLNGPDYWAFTLNYARGFNVKGIRKLIIKSTPTIPAKY